MQICNDEERFILMLQTHTIGKRANVVTEVQSSSRTVTGEQTGLL
jgi:hypothetical protein